VSSDLLQGMRVLEALYRAYEAEGFVRCVCVCAVDSCLPMQLMVFISLTRS